MVSFIDDMWISGYSIEYCWQCTRRIASILQYLGIQEAARKRTSPSLLADAWSEYVARTKDSVTKTITQAKWYKTRYSYKS